LRVHLLLKLFLFIVLAEHLQRQPGGLRAARPVVRGGRAIFLLYTCAVVLAAVLGCFDVAPVLPALIFDVYNVRIR
jgi:hypothetical protein